jgi:signal peptidase I
MTWVEWENTVVRATERYLSWREHRKAAKKARQKGRNPAVDWLDAILSAVVIVLLINQYLLQAYQIPSPSMVPTLLEGDRIFVNKIVYGPELAPGIVKLPGFRSMARGDVIIFESPEYIPNTSFLGPVLMDILQRAVYMVTLSLVDIDRDQSGNTKKHFLIKRAIGMPGDRLRMRNGNVEILLPGEISWKPEKELWRELGLVRPVVRTLDEADYPTFKSAGIGLAMQAAGLPVSEKQNEGIARYFKITRDSSGNVSKIEAIALADGKYVDLWTYATAWALDPTSSIARNNWSVLQNGWRIADDRFFPMGDNRDNSHDARYFGQVRLAKVLGQGLFRYWPIGRLGGIR